MHDKALLVARPTAPYEAAFKQKFLDFAGCVCTERTPHTDGAGVRQDLAVLAEIARTFP